MAPRAGLEPATCELTDEPPVDLLGYLNELANKISAV